MVVAPVPSTSSCFSYANGRMIRASINICSAITSSPLKHNYEASIRHGFRNLRRRHRRRNFTAVKVSNEVTSTGDNDRCTELDRDDRSAGAGDGDDDGETAVEADGTNSNGGIIATSSPLKHNYEDSIRYGFSNLRCRHRHRRRNFTTIRVSNKVTSTEDDDNQCTELERDDRSAGAGDGDDDGETEVEADGTISNGGIIATSSPLKHNHEASIRYGFSNLRRLHRHHRHRLRNFTTVRVSNKVTSTEDDDNQCTELERDDRSAGAGAGDGDDDGETVIGADETSSKGGIIATALQGLPLPQGEATSAIVSACVVGLLTGSGVVLFNYVVHELRDFFWDGVLYQGASWLREEPLEVTWKRTILVPVCGGLLVSVLNLIRDALDAPEQGEFIIIPQLKAVFQQLLKSLAACVTLGTGNSLGPEGPSVEIGSSIGKGIASFSAKSSGRKVPLVAAGSAAGIASGFNAAVAGCFFAVESVLWPSPDSAVSLTNTTSMVILSAVIASVLSEVGLGAQPAFKVPNYDFRSASELPLYLLLGILCGLVSLALTRCTTFMLDGAEEIKKAGRVPKVVFPITGGLAVGLLALAYPEILYWGFQNVDILLESRPFVKGLSADLLVQLVGVKIIATSFCRASGLVGGYYAPSIFIGAATGMAYGKYIAFAFSEFRPIQLSFIEVASPQAYGLVGMAATLAGVCQVPLTSVLLLFELTQDYRIVIPLLAAVGMSSWITSPRIKRSDLGNVKKVNESFDSQQTDVSNTNSRLPSSLYSYPTKASNADNICEIESSSCYADSDVETEEVESRIFVSEAMRTSFATVLRSTPLVEAVSLMLDEKLSYALIINEERHLIGILSIEDILEFSKSTQAKTIKAEEMLVEDICTDGRCEILWMATPEMDLLSAEIIMIRHQLRQLPVVSELEQGCSRNPVGVLDMQCIELACRVTAAKEYLNENYKAE